MLRRKKRSFEPCVRIIIFISIFALVFAQMDQITVLCTCICFFCTHVTRVFFFLSAKRLTRYAVFVLAIRINQRIPSLDVLTLLCDNNFDYVRRAHEVSGKSSSTLDSNPSSFPQFVRVPKVLTGFSPPLPSLPSPSLSCSSLASSHVPFAFSMCELKIFQKLYVN